MAEKVFVDTNILVYAIERSDAQRKKKARDLLKRLEQSASIFVSTQVLQEFYVAATRKLGMDQLLAKEITREWRRFNVVAITEDTIDEATDISILNKLSFWDALIVTAARIARCKILYSEDFNSGQIITGVKFVNPFKQS
jgi:predicted nucleic acid-binding protein